MSDGKSYPISFILNFCIVPIDELNDFKIASVPFIEEIYLTVDNWSYPLPGFNTLISFIDPFAFFEFVI